VSRMPRIRPTGAALVVGAMIGAVALAGCGAGQITQTNIQVSAVGGASGNVGSIALRNVEIAFPEQAPKTAAVYPANGDAPLQMTIANSGAQSDRLVSASSPAAASVDVTGATDIAGGQRLVIEGEPPAPPAPSPAVLPSGTAAPGASASAAPTAPASAAPGATATVAPTTAAAPAGSSTPTPAAAPTTTPAASAAAVDKGSHVVLTGLKSDVQSGLTYPVTFTFAQAGAITLDVPVALSTEARPAEPAE
jgi:copper(I)-binding protein